MQKPRPIIPAPLNLFNRETQQVVRLEAYWEAIVICSPATDGKGYVVDEIIDLIRHEEVRSLICNGKWDMGEVYALLYQSVNWDVSIIY